MEVDGRGKRGWPRRRWLECVAEDMKEKDLVEHDAADRARWKTITKNGDPTGSGTSQE